ncbi:MAG: hypothetical protein NZ893_00565 [Candidatus Aenigmarchaeota archaeon]|nr:hypothetical protein [Candidatus Aenigmarchaeota archaeon]
MVFDKPKPTVDTETVRRINDNTRRIRVIEQRLDVIDSRIKGIEEKMIDELQTLKVTFDRLYEQVRELSMEVKNMRGSLLKFEQALEKAAKKSELKEIQSLLDLYNPIKSKFVTRDELERILERKKE